MKIFDKILRKFGYVRMKRKKRSYAAASLGRLYNDWVASSAKQDEEIKRSLKILRARSRDLFQNDDYAKKFIKAVTRNVVGPHGIILQSKVKDPDGSLDTLANELIEKNWKEWSKKENASVTGKLSWIDIQRIALATTVRDGECLIRIVRNFDNSFKFALQFIDAENLPVELNKDLGTGKKIKMGVELDEWGKPVAYHIKKKSENNVYENTETERIPADQIIHLFIQEYPEQTRGVPWMHTAMTRLKMLNGYEEAELVAARVAACKMGLITSETGEEYLGEEIDTEGNIISEADPGTFEVLPAGSKLEMFDPQHPTTTYKDFVKMLLRGIAAGLDISYNSLASDLESVNYSSIRAGTLEERDAYKVIQIWMIEHFCVPVFEAWLDMALLIQKIPLPYTKFDKFNSPKFQPRGWDWVDPQKDMAANISALKAGITSWSEIAAKKGIDIEDLFRQLSEDKKMAEKYGLELKLD